MKSLKTFLAGFLLIGTALLGCDSGPPGYRITGKVTLDGEAVPAGMITFAPNGKGNKGPQGAAEISGGQYDTSKARRPYQGGPTMVRIEGHDTPMGQAIFEYQVTMDIPRESTTLDFNLKKSEIKPIPKSTEAP